MYVYRQFDPGLWTVGYYKPDGTWDPESDHPNPEAAAERVHYLNGGLTGDQVRKIQEKAYEAGFTAGQGLKG